MWAAAEGHESVQRRLRKDLISPQMSSGKEAMLLEQRQIQDKITNSDPHAVILAIQFAEDAVGKIWIGKWESGETSTKDLIYGTPRAVSRPQT